MAWVARLLAAIVGLAIIACVAHAAIMASGGYGITSAPLIMALAAGLAVGSLAIGIAWHDGRRTVAFCLVVALAAGEAWSLLLTAERTIAHRDHQQKPLLGAAEARDRAVERLKAAKAAVDHLPTTSARLQKAETAKAAADAAVVSKASEKGCRENCRQLLQAQVDAAAAEVAAARAELDGARAKASGLVKQTQAAFDALPMPQSATPLADRLGIAGWKIDLIVAALASIAANGLAACLLAFAGHGRSRRRIVDVPPAPAVVAAAPALVEVTPAPAVARDATTEADHFARTTFRPAKTGRLKLADIRAAYHAWCVKRKLHPLPDAEIGVALNRLFSSVGLQRRGTGAKAAIVGIGWSRPEPLRIEPP
jgi:hypothetical protein